MRYFKIYTFALAACLALAACDDNDINITSQPTPDPEPTPEPEPEYVINEEEYYSGGELGTVFNSSSYAFAQPTPAVENAGMHQSFMNGERFFERDFHQTKGTLFEGLGPLMVRNGCLYCHPNYGYGKRMDRYKATDGGNGYLLVFYDKSDDSYLTSLTGMPQTLAVKPFKAPLDESQINIQWVEYTDEWGNKFDDGETYSLIYPEVTVPESAFYVPIESKNGTLTMDQVGIRLEATIGVYGTGLLDAIPDDSIVAQWAKEDKYATLNPAFWNSDTHTWNSYYKGLSGEPYVRRFTYAMSRGPLLDAAGANAIWNITNVTRDDRRYHYMTAAYAKTASEDPEVQAEFYNYFPEEKTDKGVKYDIYRYLMGKEIIENEDGSYSTGANIADVDMTHDEYKDFMIWHRGLAVPAARNLDKEDVKLGHKLFRQIGCATCHRPSWTTGEDHIQDPNNTGSNVNGFSDEDMPRYPHQKIWPYTDMVQHRLFMVNDIRTGWCRTTPLWGRGLSLLVAAHQDRLHDRRARNVMEAIMWHGNKQSDARRSVEAFRKLSKEERDAVITFINSI